VSIIGDPSADVVISQQMWINITSEAERLAAMAKECAAERDALRAEVERLRAALANIESRAHKHGGPLAAWISDEPCGCDENWEE